jgi:hypothetical protein
MLDVKKRRITTNPVYHSAQTCKVVKKLSMTQLYLVEVCSSDATIIDSEFTFI